ncbi:hypothetical protein T265_05801 [Opisthorchis viverrini]|uniref:Uncharacterized protein n=1 Tax=Opisthorchis viverrini TaxID=6198 RepID=A0A074ZMY0_OPIVI|nr:hypothetical protein T265_05801 [Opisthorchis viverrini]KER27112.1 hypothetical protein T265_05801 [Opisthorchis viverrini]
MSGEHLKISTGNHFEHPNFVARIKATKHKDQTMIPDEGYLKRTNDRGVVQEPSQEWSSTSVELPRDLKGYTADGHEEDPIAQRLPEHEHQCDLLDTGTRAPKRYPTTSEPCHILSAQNEGYDLMDIQMVPDLLDPKLSTETSSRDVSGKLNGNETNPTKEKRKNVKTPAELGIDHVERPFSSFDGTKNTKIVNRRGGRNVGLPKEHQGQLTKMDDLSNLPGKKFEVEHFDECKSISEDYGGQTSTKPQMFFPKCDANLELKDNKIFPVAACELSNYLLAYHTWLAEDVIGLFQGSSQLVCHPASEYKDNVEKRVALIGKSSALGVKSVVNASELNTYSMENFKIDHSEDCTLLADSEVTLVPGESGLRTLSVDTRVDSVEIEVPGTRDAFNDLSMDLQKIDAQYAAPFVPNKRDPKISKQLPDEQVTDVRERLTSVVSVERQDLKLVYECAQCSPAEAPLKSFCDSRLMIIKDLPYENKPQPNAAPVTKRHKSQTSVSKLGDHLLTECDNEQFLHRAEHERIAGKEVWPDDYAMPETKASGAANDLYNGVLAKFEVCYFDDIDLLTPLGLEVYVGESDCEATLATNGSTNQRIPEAEGIFSGALLKQNGMEGQDDSFFVTPEELPCGASDEKAITCEDAMCRQGCRKRTSVGMQDILYPGSRPLMRAISDEFNNFTVLLEADLHLPTEPTESEEILSYGDFSPKNSFGLCHILSDQNEWDYSDEVTFVADLSDPVLPPNPVKYDVINEHDLGINEPNIKGPAGESVLYDRLLTDFDLIQPNNYTSALGSHLNWHTEDQYTKYYAHENKPTGDVPYTENPIQTNALNLVDRCIENGLSTIEEEVSLVCKDFLESIQTHSGFVSPPINSDGDEPTTLYEATFLPGIKASEIPDPPSQHVGIPVHKDYALVNHPTFTLPFTNSVEDNVVKKAMNFESSQLHDDEEVTLVSISHCEDYSLNRGDKEIYSPSEMPGLAIKKREILVSPQQHASEFAFVRTSRSDDALMTSGYEPRIDQSSNRKIKSRPNSPASSADPHSILDPPIIEPEHSCQLMNCLLNTSISNTKLINSFDNRSYPAAFPVETDNLNNLAFIPVSAAEIAARINNLVEGFTTEDSKLVSRGSGIMCAFNSNLRCSTLTSVPSTDSVNVRRQIEPARRVQHKAPELAAMLLDQGIAVFDGDAQYIPQIQKPVVYCTINCGYTFTIQLEEPQLKSLRTHFPHVNLKDERSSKSVNQKLEKTQWATNTKTKCSSPKRSQEYKCCLGTLTPAELKVVRIRQRKSAEQEDIKYLQNTGTPLVEKLAKYHTTRELPLESIHSPDSRFDDLSARLSSTSESHRISKTGSHGNPVPRKRLTVLSEISTNVFIKGPIGYRSFPRAFKRMSKLDILSSSNSPSRSNTPQILHIYTPDSFFTGGTSSEPEEHHGIIGNGAILEHMNTSHFVRHETPRKPLPKPVKNPLSCKVHANDRDSDRITMRSGS